MKDKAKKSLLVRLFKINELLNLVKDEDVLIELKIVKKHLIENLELIKYESKLSPNIVKDIQAILTDTKEFISIIEENYL